MGFFEESFVSVLMMKCEIKFSHSVVCWSMDAFVLKYQIGHTYKFLHLQLNIKHLKNKPYDDQIIKKPYRSLATIRNCLDIPLHKESLFKIKVHISRFIDKEDKGEELLTNDWVIHCMLSFLQFCAFKI